MLNRFTVSLFLLLGLLAASGVRAQDTTRTRIWQLSGMVVEHSTHDPVPYAAVKVYHSRRSIMTNNEGFYSIPVMKGDTIVIAALGYRTSFLIVENYLNEYLGNKESDYLYTINYLEEDSIQLAAVTIYPYNTPEALRTAMIEANTLMPLEEKYARQNLDPKLLDELVKTMPVDGSERASIARQIYLDQAMHKNVAPTVGLNPIAIYQLLKYLNEKAKNRKDDDLNYWEEN